MFGCHNASARVAVWSVLLVVALYASAGRAAEVAIPITNNDFSQGVDAAGIPMGWLYTGSSAQVRAEVTDERSKVGRYSVKLIDNDAGNSIALRSAPMPVG